MAVGDKKAVNASVAATSGVLDIRPPGAEEWTIHNIYYAGGVELWKTDGTNAVKFDSDTAAGGRLDKVFHVTNTVWVQLKNTTAGALVYGYDGVQTK